MAAVRGFEMASEQPFRAHSGFEVAQVAPVRGFEVASEQPFRAHSGCEVASEQPFRTHSGLEVAQMASMREIAIFLRPQVATKLRSPRDPPSPIVASLDMRPVTCDFSTPPAK